MAETIRIAAPLGVTQRPWALTSQQITGLVLVGPALVFLLMCFVWPVLHTLMLSVTAEVKDGVTIEGWTFNNYARLFSGDLYVRILLRTLRVAALSSVVSIVFSYPLALAIARGTPALARIARITGRAAWVPSAG